MIRSAVMSAVRGTVTGAGDATAASTGAGGGSVEHVPNPTFVGADPAAPWDAGGSAISVGSGQAQWFEDGTILSPIGEVANAQDFTLTIDLSNGAPVTVVVRLYNVGAATNQVVYSGTGTGQIIVNGTATALRDRIGVSGQDAGLGQLVVTKVSLTT